MGRFKILNTLVNPVTLKFRNTELESEYSLDHPEKYIFQLRLAHILSIVFFAATVVTDRQLYNEIFWPWLLRLVVVIPVFVFGLSLSYLKKSLYLRFYRELNLTYVLLTGTSFIILGYIAPSPERYLFFTGIIICLIFNYTFIRQPFILASAAGFLLSVSFILVSTLKAPQIPSLIHVTIYILVAHFLGMFIAYTLEYDDRKSYLLTIRSERDRENIKSVNENLEKQVLERTTDLEKSLVELSAAMEKAEESERLKSSFLANMSHEIRTPLNAILGFSQLVGEREIDEETRDQYVKIISDSGDRLLRIINDIIDVSKLESGQLKLDMAGCDIVQVLAESYKIFSKNEKISGNEKLRLILEIPVESCVIVTDKIRLQQVFDNLIGNAIKFTDTGSVIAGFSIREAVGAEDVVECFVKDTGIGIPEQMQEAVFQRFRQVDVGTYHEGTGIGLSISKGIVELLGGTISFESEAGKGTIFKFTLPYKMAESYGKEKGARHVSVPDLTGWELYIAEDDFASFYYLKTLLAPTGATISHAENGLKLLNMLGDNMADLILLDINMPVMSGYECIREIRKAGNNIPVIAQTAYAMSEEKDRCLKEGCNGYISKPVSRAELYRIINELYS